MYSRKKTDALLYFFVTFGLLCKFFLLINLEILSPFLFFFLHNYIFSLFFFISLFFWFSNTADEFALWIDYFFLSYFFSYYFFLQFSCVRWFCVLLWFVGTQQNNCKYTSKRFLQSKVIVNYKYVIYYCTEKLEKTIAKKSCFY